MSEAAKKRPTDPVEFRVGNKCYEVPKSKAGPILKALKGYESDLIPADEVFAELDLDSPGVTLQGFRLKESLTQKQLAEKLGIAQNFYSDLETGRRKISAKMARKLAEILETDYRVFL